MHRIAEITTSLAMVGILAIGLATYQNAQAAAPTAAVVPGLLIRVPRHHLWLRRQQPMAQPPQRRAAIALTVVARTLPRHAPSNR